VRFLETRRKSERRPGSHSRCANASPVNLIIHQITESGVECKEYAQNESSNEYNHSRTLGPLYLSRKIHCR
jgi:hypothetical protein